MCPAYVAGLIGSGDRKSIQPMAARDGDVGYDQLHHFITSGTWDTTPLEKVLLAEADRMVGGADAWLIGEHRSNGERKYDLSNLPADTSLTRLAGAIKARWICEQAHQQLKEELGLDHFEGRSWAGLHRHALMTMIAYAFLQSRRLQQAKREKKKPGPATAPDPSRNPGSHHLQARKATANASPSLSRLAYS
jgi:SRSO17 transposase